MYSLGKLCKTSHYESRLFRVYASTNMKFALVFEEKWVPERGKSRIMLPLCFLNSEFPSKEQPSFTAVPKNFDSNFHLVSIREGNLENSLPRNYRTCTS